MKAEADSRIPHPTELTLAEIATMAASTELCANADLLRQSGATEQDLQLAETLDDYAGRIDRKLGQDWAKQANQRKTSRTSEASG